MAGQVADSVVCVCGSSVKQYNHSAHLSTKKHRNYMTQQNGAVPVPATLGEVMANVRAAPAAADAGPGQLRFVQLRDCSAGSLVRYLAANSQIHRKIIIECGALLDLNAVEAECRQSQIRCAIYRGLSRSTREAGMQALHLFADDRQAVLACYKEIPKEVGDTFCRMGADVPQGRHAVRLAQASKKWNWIVLPEECTGVIRQIDPSALNANGTPGPRVQEVL